MELKVGRYVRYTRGAINGYVPTRIAKIVDCSDNELVRIDSWQVILRNDVIKARDNLIDLIEVGDYVNGHLVLDVFWNVEEDHVILIEDSMNNSTSVLYNEDIKSIVTKEQFESIKYEVE